MAQVDLIVLIGPTGSGKSSVAFETAKKFNGEIIAADSRTIYRQMDIGTAKPSSEEQKEVPHHMIDICDPGEKFSAHDFKAQADIHIKTIQDSGKLPILVGGTGLYVDSVLFDYQFRDVDKDLRAELELLETSELEDRAAKIDPKHDFASNRRHLVRFLESGEHPEPSNTPAFNALVIGISPPKNVLRKRIQKRVEKMFKLGLRKEVEHLVEQYGWDSEAMTGIGYREFESYYDNEISMSKVKRDIVQSTLGYAKRQRTWFKRNALAEWVETPEEAIELIDKKLRRGSEFGSDSNAGNEV